MKELKVPISRAEIAALTAGDMVYITGKIYTARDAAHKRIAELIEAGKEPPFTFEGQIVFYAGPSPAKPGKPTGSVGPTTSERMDRYSPLLISRGLTLMIGKGERSAEVTRAIVKYGGVYFASIGGAAALTAGCVRAARLVAFEELGTEAVREFEVEKLPVFVAIDSRGTSLYEAGRRKYRK